MMDEWAKRFNELPEDICPDCFGIIKNYLVELGCEPTESEWDW